MLVDLTLRTFLETLASEDPAPGGGSASALAGAQGAALIEMVVAITVKNDKYASARPALEPVQPRAARLRAELTALVDRDAEAYHTVVAANRLPKATDEEKAARKAARERAFLFAAQVPLETAERSCELAALAAEAAPHVNPNTASDVLVAGLLAEAAFRGAAANVRINLGSLKETEFAANAERRLAEWGQVCAASVSAVRAATTLG